MVQMIEELQKRAKQTLLPPMQRLMQRLKDNAVEVVSVDVDRQPVTWLWCCSEPPGDGVEHFASTVFRELSEAVSSFQSLNVDDDQLKRDFSKFFHSFTNNYLWGFNDNYFIRNKIIIILKTQADAV